MKVAVFIVFLFAFCFYEAYSALSVAEPDPNHPGHCYLEGIGEMDFGQEKYLENCGKASCGNDGFLTLSSCGIAIHEPCPENPIDVSSKPYPECCKPTNC